MKCTKVSLQQWLCDRDWSRAAPVRSKSRSLPFDVKGLEGTLEAAQCGSKAVLRIALDLRSRMLRAGSRIARALAPQAPSMRRQMSTVAESVAKKSPEEVGEWAKADLGITCENLKVFPEKEISGKVLLQMKKHELVQAGMTPGAATEIMMALTPPAPAHKTIKIDMSEGEEDPVEFTIKSQSDMEKLFLQYGAGGLMNGTNRSVRDFEELKDGDSYIFVFYSSSGMRKLEKSVGNQQRRLNNMTKAMEKQANAALLKYAKKIAPDACEIPVKKSGKQGVSNPDGLIISDTTLWVAESKANPLMGDFDQIAKHVERYQKEYPNHKVIPVLFGDNFSETDAAYKYAIKNAVLVGTRSPEGFTVGES
eukprot:m.397868 g.397868  ORF g.397868 m.397868 type:complete len:365 (-) comp16773_c2_seq38:395-1489(-)